MGASFGKQKKSRAGKLDISGRWTPLPHTVIHSQEYRGLSYPARSLLFDIAAQYNGKNNGSLVACTRYLKPLGWNSNDTISRALKQLNVSGILIQTRQGMRPPCSQAAWFSLGWFGLDITSGLDINPKKYQRSKLTPIEKIARPLNGVKEISAIPFNGAGKVATTPSHGTILTENSRATTPTHGDYIYLPSKQEQTHSKEDGVIH